MKSVLFDEGVPVQLAPPLRRAGFAVTTVHELGWNGVSNGELLRRAEARFDVLLTNDKNIQSQIDMRGRKLAIGMLPTNRRRIVLARLDDIVALVDDAAPGRCVVLD